MAVSLLGLAGLHRMLVLGAKGMLHGCVHRVHARGPPTALPPCRPDPTNPWLQSSHIWITQHIQTPWVRAQWPRPYAAFVVGLPLAPRIPRPSSAPAASVDSQDTCHPCICPADDHGAHARCGAARLGGAVRRTS